MTTLSLGQAARLTGRGKTMLARAISGRLFAASKEDGGSNIDGAESARVYPFPAPVETVAELRTRLTLAEERLSELKAMLEDMRRDRDAWREQAQTRLLPAPAARMSWWSWRRTAGWGGAHVHGGRRLGKCCAAEQRDELTPFQLIELPQSLPAGAALQDVEWAGISQRVSEC
jgi:hypothetical protein